MWQLITDRACELFHAEQGVVLITSEADLPVDDVDTLVVSTAVGMHADEVLANGFRSVGLPLGGGFRAGMPVITEAFRHPVEAFTDIGQRPAIVMPLRSEHIVLGVMVVARHIDQTRFEPKMSTL